MITPLTRKGKTITFQPAKDVIKILNRTVKRRMGRKGSKRGWTTKLINESCRLAYGKKPATV